MHKLLLFPTIVTSAKPFLGPTVHEFYSNLSSNISNASYWDTLTESVLSKCPRSHNFPASDLTVKYCILHKIFLANWSPSAHTISIPKGLAVLLYMIGIGTSFDFGKHIFDEIVSHAEEAVSYTKLPFPS